MQQKQTLIMGGLGKLDPDGLLYKALDNQQEYDITPTVSGVKNYTFGYGAVAYPLVSRVLCIAVGDTNSARTSLGVGELVNLSGLPNETKWSTGAGSVTPTTWNSTLFTAPSNGMSATVTATVRKASATIDFEVKEPEGVEATITSTTGQFINNGVAGAWMHLDVIVQPTTVSFNRISVMEIGQEASDKTGYFTTNSPGPHNTAFGANAEHAVNCANLINSPGEHMDTCSYWGNASGYLPGPPWSSGSFTWHIPAVWWVGSGPTNNLPWSDQVFNLSADGTFSISKFGKTVTRTINNVITPNL